jgi:hypothetical protein
MVSLLKADKKRAQELFEMAVATRLSPYPEYSLSLFELGALKNPPKDERLEQMKKRA